MNRRRLRVVAGVGSATVLILGGVVFADRLHLLPIRVEQCPPSEGETSLTALWIGDSYTLGQGLPEGDGYACLVSEQLGWEPRLDAEGSTGFLADGANRTRWFSPLPDRLSDTIEEGQSPDVVIVDAGRNDVLGFPEATVEEAAADYLHRVVAAWPDARVVVILPWSARDPSSDPHPLADEIRTAAKSAGVDKIVSPVDLGLSGSVADRLQVDGTHPDADANEFIARRLVEALAD